MVQKDQPTQQGQETSIYKFFEKVRPENADRLIVFDEEGYVAFDTMKSPFCAVSMCANRTASPAPSPVPTFCANTESSSKGSRLLSENPPLPSQRPVSAIRHHACLLFSGPLVSIGKDPVPVISNLPNQTDTPPLSKMPQHLSLPFTGGTCAMPSNQPSQVSNIQTFLKLFA